MKRKYYVHKYIDNRGDHEVHEEGCQKMPNPENRIYLGEFTSCKDAVAAARSYFQQVNGCYYCSLHCHTS